MNALAACLVTVRNVPSLRGRVIIFYHDTLTLSDHYVVDMISEETGLELITMPKINTSKEDFRNIDKYRFENLLMIDVASIYLDSDAFLSSNWTIPKKYNNFVVGKKGPIAPYVNYESVIKSIIFLNKKLSINSPPNTDRVNLGGFWSPDIATGKKISTKMLELMREAPYCYCLGEFAMTALVNIGMVISEDSLVQDLGFQPAKKIYKEGKLWTVDGRMGILHAHDYNKNLSINEKNNLFIDGNDKGAFVFCEDEFEKL
jgi:hypothetical protein